VIRKKIFIPAQVAIISYPAEFRFFCASQNWHHQVESANARRNKADGPPVRQASRYVALYAQYWLEKDYFNLNRMNIR
jgi:hypothetical protein